MRHVCHQCDINVRVIKTGASYVGTCYELSNKTKKQYCSRSFFDKDVDKRQQILDLM